MSAPSGSSIPIAPASLLPMKDVTTALAVLLPEQFCDSVNSIRKVHDRAYPRWMPHINLYFPFVQGKHFKEVVPALESVLKGIEPFEISLDHLDPFHQSQGKSTWHLECSQPKEMVKMYESVESTLEKLVVMPPPKDRRPFHPHLTLAQCMKKEDGNMKNLLSEALKVQMPIKFKCTELVLLQRSQADNSVPFAIKHRIQLGA